MSKPGVSELLIRAALDVVFRQRVLSEPDIVFPEFDLSDEQQEILRKRDDRMFDLLGTALRASMPISNESEAAAHTPTSEGKRLTGDAQQATMPLREAKLLLQVVPCAQQGTDGMLQIAYAAELHALNEGTAPDSVPLPAQTPPGSPLPPLRMVVRVVPTLSKDPDGHHNVTFCISSENLFGDHNSYCAPGDSLWNHRTDSQVARQAAAAVRSATPEARFDCLLALIDALQQGDVDD